MADETTTINATCLCGAARHGISLSKSELPLKQSMCHCHSCRHMTGTLCLTLVNLPETYAPAQELIEKLTPFSFSKRVTQYHCSKCGSSMLAHCWKDGDDHSKGAQWDAMTGSLDQAEGVFEPSLHEFISDTLDGGFADFLPAFNDKSITRWAAWPDKSEQLPLYWHSDPNKKVDISPSDKLHAHCKCGGVNFWIARPSERSKNASSGVADLLIPHSSKQPPPEPYAWWLRDNDTKFFAGVCFCNSCRLDTGMEWMEWAFIPTVDISLDEAGNTPFSLPFGTLKAFASSPDVLRYHCGTCGASVFFTCDERNGLVDVAVGVLDAPEGARAESWLDWCTNRVSFPEDAIPRGKDHARAIESGLEQFGKRMID